MFFGIVIVLAVVFMPRGLADLVRGFRAHRLGYFARQRQDAPAVSAADCRESAAPRRCSRCAT